MASPPDLTRLLQDWSQGNKVVLDQLTPVIYHELRSLARARLATERPGHTLQRTALIHEAYFKLVGHQQSEWKSRSHFFAVASQIMREILVDHARRHRSEKRGGGGEKVSLEDVVASAGSRDGLLVDLDDGLKELTKIDPRKSQAVEMTYFGGMGQKEIAEALGVSIPTVVRDLRMAQAWLHNYLSGQ